MTWVEIVGKLIDNILSWQVAVVTLILILDRKGHVGGVLDALSERIKKGGLFLRVKGKETLTEVLLSETMPVRGEIREAENTVVELEEGASDSDEASNGDS